ncbi:MAG: hypothetical protein JWN52_3216, partial [Actinomycetia bacterium]|nr:hypothetical protein [Actinomycetes bacterium]
GPDGAPHVQPVAFWVNVDTETIDIGGPALWQSQKFRNIQPTRGSHSSSMTRPRNL